jgi:translation elongation factor EF-G
LFSSYFFLRCCSLDHYTRGLADLASKDLQLRIQAIMRSWLPLHAAVLGMVVRKLPSPVEAQQKRLEKLWPSIIGSVALSYHNNKHATPAASSSLAHTDINDSISLQERLQAVRNSVAACDTSPDAECVVFVSKMFVVPKASLPAPDVAAPIAAVPEIRAWWGMDASKIGTEPLGSKLDTRSITSKRRRETEAVDSGALEDLSDVETFIAFARVFSGVLRPGTFLHYCLDVLCH